MDKVELIFRCAAVATSAIAVAALTINYRNRGTEKTKITRDLYLYFYSDGMLKSRERAWFWLEQLQKNNKPYSFETLWRNRNDADNFAHLYKVLAFWLTVYTLYTETELNQKVGRELFGYEYIYWAEQVDDLLQKTRESDERLPEILKPFDGRKWLNAKVDNKSLKKGAVK